MQSTSNTAASLAMRPKIGRPPGLPALAVPATPPEAADTAHTRRWDARILLLSIGVVLMLTLVLSRALAPAPKNLASPALSALEASAVSAAAARPAPSLKQTDSKDTVFYAAPAKSSDGAAPNTAIDNEDRQRLLSIISKD